MPRTLLVSECVCRACDIADAPCSPHSEPARHAPAPPEIALGLVLFALKYRVTFYVLAVFILLAGGGSAVVMRKDVLPEVNIPVVNVLWTYTGLDAPDMQNYVTSYEELAISNNVVGVRDLESTTLQGITLTKIYFYGDTDISLALSQVTAATNAIIGILPAGIQPPVVLRFNASSVPVIQLAVTSDTESGDDI